MPEFIDAVYCNHRQEVIEVYGYYGCEGCPLLKRIDYKNRIVKCECYEND